MMNYSDILASIIHDIKNSISVVSNHVAFIMQASSLSDDLPPRARAMPPDIRRANNQLIQVLTLYKMDRHRLSSNLQENNVYDFLEELLIEDQALAEAQHIAITVDCDEWLSGYFDADLVRGVLSSTIGNAKRYTKDQVLLSADEEEGFLVIRVEDNGEGFPSDYLQYDHKADDEDFGRALMEHVLPELLGREDTGMLDRASISSGGALTEAYAYLQNYLEGKE